MLDRRDIINNARLSELKRKRRRVLYLKIGGVILGVAILLTGLTLLSRLSRFSIRTVTVSGAFVINENDIQAVAEKSLAGKYLWLFPHRNILLYPKHRIERDIRAAFPRIKDIHISKSGLESIAIAVVEESGQYLWCGTGMPDPSVKETCYFVNDSAHIFDVAPYFSGNVYFKFYGPLLSGDAATPIGGALFKSELLGPLLAFKDGLAPLGLPAYALYMKDAREYDFLLTTPDKSSNPKIVFNPQSSLSTILANLSAALKGEPMKSEIATKLPTLLYIDLRFENKVYYKFNK